MLVEARGHGFLGPGELEPQIAHARAYAAALAASGVDEPGRVVDLGSGGGLPSLVLVESWPHSTWLLVEAIGRRAQFLREAVRRMGLEDRVEVVGLRAELVGHEHRGEAAVVTSRGFGPPSVTAECAAGLLRVGGRLLVSEPPGGDPSRWPQAALRELGLELDRIDAGPPAIAVLRQAFPCPDRYPRRVGVPAKRPLWHEEH